MRWFDKVGIAWGTVGMCLICSGITFAGVKNIYQQVLNAQIEERKNDQIANLMLHRKLNQCAVEFGTYIATKGKNGQRYFEHH